jgi:hypothetical protein
VGLTFDDSGDLWMVSVTTSSLYRIDPTTGAATPSGSLNQPFLNSLAWDGASLYAVEHFFGNLYSIDRASGISTLVGPLLAVDPIKASGLTADSKGDLWGLAEDGTIFTVDKSTGEATVVSTTLAVGFNSLAIDHFTGVPQSTGAPIGVPAVPPWAIGMLFALLPGFGARVLGARGRASRKPNPR